MVGGDDYAMKRPLKRLQAKAESCAGLSGRWNGRWFTMQKENVLYEEASYVYRNDIRMITQEGDRGQINSWCEGEKEYKDAFGSHFDRSRHHPPSQHWHQDDLSK